MLKLLKYEILPEVAVEYNRVYPELFSSLKELILSVLPEVEVQHIGSTAVPGCFGKSVIDILVPCEERHFPEFLTELEKVGFQHSPFEKIPEDRPLRVAKVQFSGQGFGVHVHLTKRGSDCHLNNLVFRDRLRADSNLAFDYGELKKEAFRRKVITPKEYNEFKDSFIKRVIQS